nr:unnamed protein product [Callosobruchus analis]
MQMRKILNLQSDRRRLKARIDNLNSLLSYLQEQYGITESAASIMSLHYKVHLNYILRRCRCIYIAGFIAEPLSQLQIRKTYGSMINASRLVIDICKIGEKSLRIAKARGNLLKPNVIPILLEKNS